VKVPRYWEPLQRTQLQGPHPEASIRLQMERCGGDRAKAIELLEAYEATCEYYTNNLYQVQKRSCAEGFVHLNIRRRDGAIDLRDWRHFQQIKNELVGPECEAVELYPAESRLVDTSNKFHLWVCTDPTFRFPMGFKERDVIDANPKSETPGTKQRPF
jgi:hypothetical protein